jgi:hypothetical protein
MSYVIQIREEPYVTLTTIAECYDCSVVWVEEVYGLGMLGSGEKWHDETLVPVVALEHLARILRFHVGHGVDLDLIQRLID